MTCTSLNVSLVHGVLWVCGFLRRKCFYIFLRCRLGSVQGLLQVSVKLSSEDSGRFLTNVLCFVYLAPDGPYWELL